VHLLPWNGAALVEHVPVSYGAELPRLPTPASEREPVALVVADPTETLDLSRKELEAATRRLAAQGWTLDVPTPARADRERILEGLAQASFFYFSGHGEHDVRPARMRALPPYAGGTADWPARLKLKLPTVLEVQDVLMLPSAPRQVTLLGCETGVPSGNGGGMSLALAFLVAGAEAVVATPEKTITEVSFATALGLLERMSATTPDLARALATTQAGMLARGETIGRYRVWVR
jgi:CHAT domain-containing protein